MSGKSREGEYKRTIVKVSKLTNDIKTGGHNYPRDKSIGNLFTGWALNDMYYYPGDQTFLLGDGRYLNDFGGYYGGIDAGYMRYLLFGGVFYSLFVYILFCFFFIYMFIVIKKSFKGALWLVLCLFFMSFVFHYKGNFLFISVYNSKLYFSIIFFFILLNKFKDYATYYERARVKENLSNYP